MRRQIVSSTKASTSSAVGGMPHKSSVARRIRVRSSAGRETASNPPPRARRRQTHPRACVPGRASLTGGGTAALPVETPSAETKRLHLSALATGIRVGRVRGPGCTHANPLPQNRYRRISQLSRRRHLELVVSVGDRLHEQALFRLGTAQPPAPIAPFEHRRAAVQTVGPTIVSWGHGTSRIDRRGSAVPEPRRTRPPRAETKR